MDSFEFEKTTMKNTLLFLVLFSGGFNSFAFAQPGTDPSHSPRFLVHLLDYLAKDYSGAISNDGKVISQSEYNEQVEFVENAVRTNSQLIETKGTNEIEADLKRLEGAIKLKTAPNEVVALARSIQQRVIITTHLEIAPGRWPDLDHGEVLFHQNCASCHGESGNGKGIAGKNLSPQPANFLDTDRMRELSPFNAFNTTRLGVPGTAMVGFQTLSDEEIWELAFFISSLRHKGVAAKVSDEWNPRDAATLKEVASSSDVSLLSKFGGTEIQKQQALAALRTYREKNSQHNYLDLAKMKLEEAKVDFEKGNFDLAKTKALQAYLEGIEPIEPRIKANDPSLVSDIEEKMAAVRGLIENRGSSENLNAAILIAEAQINTISQVISEKEMSPWVSFFAAVGVLLREGFEAVLIILALLGVIRAANATRAARWVHGGWIAALGLGAVSWIFSTWVMDISGASRELLEGAISLFAVAVLLYVGFWLHRQSEIGRWKSFLEVKVKGLLEGKNLFGLAVISFIAVFREAFETVLFLKAIELETHGAARTALYLGIIGSLTLVIALSWIALSLSRRLPLRSLFTVSSVLMLALATILTGKGLHSLQEIGLIRATATPLHFRWELVGIYPTLETGLAQLVSFGLVLLLWWYGRRPAHR
jgi:high-affinity iron transporter